MVGAAAVASGSAVGDVDAGADGAGDGSCDAVAEGTAIRFPASPMTTAVNAVDSIAAIRLRGAPSGCKLGILCLDLFIYNSGTGSPR